ncbi:MAG: phosphatidylglycerophosphate synthase [Candidatus Azotimanducaceae bacterium]|jgi:phosphatidylglycerophosphate synthase
MSLISDLNLDKKITDWILNRFNIFENVHPNVLSCVGLLMDFVIFNAILAQSLLITGFGMLIRYLCDCLDGAIARKYNKVSDIGGILDTAADNVMIFILSFGILQLLMVESSLLISFVLTGLNLTYLALQNSLIHHGAIKVRGSSFHNLYRFGVNNNILLYAATYLVFASVVVELVNEF